MPSKLNFTAVFNRQLKLTHKLAQRWNKTICYSSATFESTHSSTSIRSIDRIYDAIHGLFTRLHCVRFDVVLIFFHFSMCACTCAYTANLNEFYQTRYIRKNDSMTHINMWRFCNRAWHRDEKDAIFTLSADFQSVLHMSNRIVIYRFERFIYKSMDLNKKL